MRSKTPLPVARGTTLAVRRPGLLSNTVHMGTRAPACSVTAGRVVGRFLFVLGH